MNVKTLATQGKKDLILNELNRYKWDIVGLSEKHLPTTGKERIGNASLIVAGRTDGINIQGVGSLISSRARGSLIYATPVSERLIIIRIKESPINITIIQVYTPDSSIPDVESKIFYLKLQSLVNAFLKKIFYWSLATSMLLLERLLLEIRMYG
jgi:exonuclease III